MPQLTKGGKFVFGLCIIKPDFRIQLPQQTISEYELTRDDKVFLFTGSKITGGFCVTSKALLEPSKLSHILTDCPQLSGYELEPCEFIRYKGRGYCWANLDTCGAVHLTREALSYLDLFTHNELLCIRSSNIAFTMGAKGPLLDKALCFQGKIEHY